MKLKPRRPGQIARSLPSTMVSIEEPGPTGRLPVTIRPALAHVSLPYWVHEHADEVRQLMHRHAAVLFRGFPVHEQADFEAVVDGLDLNRMHYVEGATPRRRLGNDIYTSTEFPAAHTIALHNELSYVVRWPMRLCFCCLQPASAGGATPIADVRRVLQRIAPEVREEFARRGWMLVRNFGDGFSLSWRTAFGTDDRRILERYCRDSAVEWEWHEGERLRTRHIRPAIRTHPVTGETLWFNHIVFWNAASLPAEVREGFLSRLASDELPYNTFYGDGAPISPDVIAHLQHAYDLETADCEWHSGDVLLLDNMLAAHGRRPYEGTRRVIVAMGDPSPVDALAANEPVQVS
jgi:alpha-ketoglutarate-dependent taurine dioxygenase